MALLPPLFTASEVESLEVRDGHGFLVLIAPISGAGIASAFRI